MAEKVSVIIPVFNAAPYLRCCVDSVRNQSYADLEIILVDDGSTDASGGMCDALAEEDPRIRVIHQANLGHSLARNAGLEAAAGQWICFVDSDDFLHPEAVASMMRAKEDGCDLVITGFSGAFRANVDITISDQSVTQQLRTVPLSPEILIEELIRGKGPAILRSAAIWAKLYSRDLVGDLRFRDYYTMEDRDFNLRYLLKARRVLYISNDLYYYCQSPNSIVRNPSTRNLRLFRNLKGFHALLEDVPEHPECRGWILGEVYKEMITRRYLLNGSEYEADFETLCRGIVAETRKEFRRSRFVSLRDKILFAVLWKCPRLAACAMKKMGN